MPFRIACTIFLFISVCAFPVYFTLAIGLFSVIWFKNYYELVPLFFVSDVLYGVPLERFHSFPYIMTAVACLLVLISVVVRRQIFDTSLQRI